MKEKRKYKRVKKYFGINIISVDKGGKHFQFNKCKTSPKFYDESGVDFNPKGVQIMCSKPLPVESLIQMKIIIPNEYGLNLIRANGTVKWFKQIKSKFKRFFIMGVHFKKLTNEDKDKLKRLWKKYKDHRLNN